MSPRIVKTRRPLIAGNWKMHIAPSEVAAYVSELRIALEADREAIGREFDLALAPPATSLDRLGVALSGSGVLLAAQNVHSEKSGAFTGEIAVGMLEDLGCRYALIGHSERRQICGERDEDVAAKAAALQESTVDPILCVGETLEEREADRTLEIVRRQVGCVVDRVGDGLMGRLVVAYEPIWAIGTGRTATPEIAQEVHAAIRAYLVERLGSAAVETRILYGGSVKPSNAQELLAQPDVDGALVGGASLVADDFAAIALASVASSKL